MSGVTCIGCREPIEVVIGIDHVTYRGNPHGLPVAGRKGHVTIYSNNIPCFLYEICHRTASFKKLKKRAITFQVRPRHREGETRSVAHERHCPNAAFEHSRPP